MIGCASQFSQNKDAFCDLSKQSINFRAWVTKGTCQGQQRSQYTYVDLIQDHVHSSMAAKLSNSKMSTQEDTYIFLDFFGGVAPPPSHSSTLQEMRTRSPAPLFSSYTHTPSYTLGPPTIVKLTSLLVWIYSPNLQSRRVHFPASDVLFCDACTCGYPICLFTCLS